MSNRGVNLVAETPNFLMGHHASNELCRETNFDALIERLGQFDLIVFV